MTLEALRGAPAIVLTNGTPTPLEVAGKDDVFIGRIRKTPGRQGVLNLFLVFDNLRRGAATNTIDIIEAMLER